MLPIIGFEVNCRLKVICNKVQLFISKNIKGLSKQPKKKSTYDSQNHLVIIQKQDSLIVNDDTTKHFGFHKP